MTDAREQGLDTHEHHWHVAFGIEIATSAAFALIAVLAIRRGARTSPGEVGAPPTASWIS